MEKIRNINFNYTVLTLEPTCETICSSVFLPMMPIVFAPQKHRAIESWTDNEERVKRTDKK